MSSVICKFNILIVLITFFCCSEVRISISGTVVDQNGLGISGATIQLVNAGISTISNGDGRFVLTNVPTTITEHGNTQPNSINSFNLINGKIKLVVFENVEVVLDAFDIHGRKIFSTSKLYATGTHSLILPVQSRVYLYKLKVGNMFYSFKHIPIGNFSHAVSASFSPVSFHNKAFAKINNGILLSRDILSVKKDGQLNYKDSIKSYDTTGLLVTMVPSAGALNDIDGNVYQCVKIGSKVWTVENLRTTRYNDGQNIPKIVDSVQWANLDTPGYCFYENWDDTLLQAKWGALYNWYAINTSKLAPSGWHVATAKDWEELVTYLKDNGYSWDRDVNNNEVAKAVAAKTEWFNNSTNMTSGSIGKNMSINNTSGFTALPGGYRTDLGVYVGFYYTVYLWSSTYFLDPTGFLANKCMLTYNNPSFVMGTFSKRCGLYVRLVKD